MTLREMFVEAVTTPWVLASSVVVSVLQLSGVWPLVDFAMAQASLWFPSLAIISGTLVPRVDWLPQDILMAAFVITASAVAVRRVDSAIETMRDRYT